ncbi:uncharacterized protein [Aegilops tauschii subsp. strangulata]|uniref:uncharacterized protein n=1 Tax=Aegilops tauschii subsp. strangulata TaxID=200361 RepID=UPI00098A4A06|nr:uncharacterized protein LOC109746396 [Aegilops tauschii subsp. strangulata]
MDEGSSLNIIFTDSVEKMKISLSGEHKSNVGSHGVVEGRPVCPLESIELEVLFGDESNYLSETIQFELVPFQSGYHAILGKPAYIKFMAVPSYAYLQLKMHGPNGMITVRGSTKTAYKAEVANVELAEAALASANLTKIRKRIGPSEAELPQKPRPGPVFQLAKQTKKF